MRKWTWLLLVVCAARADLEAGVEAVARRDYATALREFKPLAEQGNVVAQVNLGNLFMKGLGVRQNYGEAARWYRNAAEQNERLAQSKLGILYYYGLGVPKDPEEAARWFEKAARQGEPSAQTVLATLYAQGEGVQRDLAQAYYWYTLAAEQGSEEALRGRGSLAEEITPGQMDEALKLLADKRRSLREADETALDKSVEGLAVETPGPVSEGRPKPSHEKRTHTHPRRGKKTRTH